MGKLPGNPGRGAKTKQGEGRGERRKERFCEEPKERLSVSLIHFPIRFSGDQGTTLHLPLFLPV